MPLYLQTIIFLSLGLICWLLASKFVIPSYGRQSVTFEHFFQALLNIVIVKFYFFVLQPVLLIGLVKSSFLFAPIRGFFSASPPLMQLCTYIVLTDFFAYWIHRWLHSEKFWRIHAFHHSPKKLNWLSGMRASPVNQFIINLPYTLASFMIMFTRVHEIYVFLFIKEAFFQSFQHSSISLPFTKTIERVFVTPRVHFVHHHPDPKFTNSNYGFIFSAWDKMFGTYTDPSEIPASEAGQLGLDYEQSTTQLLLCRRSPQQHLAENVQEDSKAS